MQKLYFASCDRAYGKWIEIISLISIAQAIEKLDCD